MYDASDLSPIVMVEVRTLSFGGSRDAAVCAPTTCAQQELGQQCTWNKSQEWRRGAGQSHWSVKSPIAVCPQPACSVSSPHTLLHICLTSSNDTFCVNPHQYRCSFPHYCENDFDSLICSNARLHMLQRRSYRLLYKYRFTINKYGHKVLQIPLEILAFISEHSGIVQKYDKV